MEHVAVAMLESQNLEGVEVGAGEVGNQEVKVTLKLSSKSLRPGWDT